MVLQICGTANSTVRISRMRPTVRIVPLPSGSDGMPFTAGPWFTGGSVCCAAPEVFPSVPDAACPSSRRRLYCSVVLPSGVSAGVSADAFSAGVSGDISLAGSAAGAAEASSIGPAGALSAEVSTSAAAGVSSGAVLAAAVSTVSAAASSVPRAEALAAAASSVLRAEALTTAAVSGVTG